MTALVWMHDLSSRSDACLPLVAGLARAVDDRVRIVHALGASMDATPLGEAGSTSAQRVDERRRIDATGPLEACRQRLLDHGVRCDVELLPGRPVEAGKAAYDAEPYRIAVIARSSSRGLDRLLLGSEAARLLRDLPAAVLVHPGTTGSAISRIAIAVDPEDCQGAEIQLGAELAHATRAQVELVTVMQAGLGGESPQESAARLKAWAPTVWRTPLPEGWTVRVLVDETVQGGLLRAAQDTDLLIVATRGLRGWQRILLGSVAEALAKTCPVPLLVAR